MPTVLQSASPNMGTDPELFMYPRLADPEQVSDTSRQPETPKAHRLSTIT